MPVTPPAVLAHGAFGEIGGLKWRLRPNDFDSLIYSCDSANENHIVPGSPCPVEGLAHMRAVDVQPEQVGDAWVFSNTEFRGFKNPLETWRKFSRTKNSPSEGFDNISLTLGCRDASLAIFARGSTLPNKEGVPPEFPNMWIMDITEEDTEIQNEAGLCLYPQLGLQLRGLLGPKPYTRRYNGASQTFTPDGTWEMYDSINELGETINGWMELGEGAQLAELSLAKLVMTDSFVTLTEPPFGGIPGNVEPEDAPAYTDLTFWTTGDTRYHWPFGWRRASITSEKLPGKDCWAWSVTYEFQQMILPG